MDMTGKTPLLIYSFSAANNPKVPNSDILKRKINDERGCEQRTCVSLGIFVHPCLSTLTCSNVRICIWSVMAASAFLLFIHAFNPFL